MEKPDTVRYADTGRYNTYTPGCLNTPAREVFYRYEEEEVTSLASRFKHLGKGGFPYI